MLERDWCRHRPASRAIEVTESGRAALSELFGVRFEQA
jgi:hypothetical protein